MSQSANIEKHYIDTYEGNLRHELQASSSMLSGAVMQGSFTGEKKRFDFVGSVEMQEILTRNEDTKWLDNDYNSRWVYGRDFSVPQIVDKKDIRKLLQDPTSTLITSAKKSANRRKDLSIIEALGGTAYTGKDATAAVALPSVQKMDIQEGGSSSDTGMNLAKILEAKYLLDKSDIDDDGSLESKRYFAISALQLKELLQTTEIKSSDYNSVKALVNGDINTFAGFEFIRLSEKILNDSGTTGVRNCYAWVKCAVQNAVCLDVTTKAAELPQKHFNYGVETFLSLGAVRLYDEGVVQVPCVDAAVL
jgi:hypothetical protein